MGVSHKSSIEYILANDEKDKIKIFAEGFANLRDSHLHLNKSDRKRVIFSDYESADYIIDSKMKRQRVNNNLSENNNLELFYELIIDQQPINSIYKKILKKRIKFKSIKNMRSFILKTSIITIAAFILYKITIGHAIESFSTKVKSLTNQHSRIELKQKF